jgi:hypothetical protein
VQKQPRKLSRARKKATPELLEKINARMLDLKTRFNSSVGEAGLR